MTIGPLGGAPFQPPLATLHPSGIGLGSVATAISEINKVETPSYTIFQPFSSKALYLPEKSQIFLTPHANTDLLMTKNDSLF